ncbi:MAG: Tfp pilus assembly protein PilF [Promethearchaeota archaeon CR_4]|nr:MAG: Tfp pilus assembly protein PilF [Candidatus Lokiarchaeota archaeon CR_4]
MLEELNEQIMTLWNAGKQEKAIEIAQDAAYSAEKSHGSKDPAVAIALRNLGKLYTGQCDYDQAETFLVKAFDIEREALGLHHKDTFETMNDLGDLYSMLHSYGQAEEYYLLALDALKQNLSLDRTMIPKMLFNLGRAQFYLGLFEDARNSFDEALKFQEGQRSLDPELWGSLLFSKGKIFINQNQLDSGIAMLEQAYQHDRENLEEVHPNLARDLFQLADAYRLEGSSEKAKKSLQDYIELVQRACGRDQPELVLGLHHLAQVLFDRQEFQEAEGVIQRALRITRKVYEKNSRVEAGLLGLLADVLLKLGRTSEAAKYLHQSQKILAIHSPAR